MRHEKVKDKNELVAEAQEFLREQKVAVLSTVDQAGEPQAATIFYYLADGNSFNFYFFTQDLTNKFQNLQKNNRAALTIFTESDPVLVQARGRVVLVEDSKETKDVISKLTDVSINSSKWYDPPIAKIKAGSLKVMKVEVDWLRYADFRQLSSSPSPFHQIIP